MQKLLINNLRAGFKANAELGLKLAAAIDPADMTDQPAPGVNHPAWIFKHLSTYHPVILDLLHGRDPQDPKDAPFGKNSAPVADASVYGPWDDVVTEYRAGYQAILQALDHAEASDPAPLFRAMPVERWRERFPMAGGVLGYLMVHHEGFHIGQLSAWRRFRGLPSV